MNNEKPATEVSRLPDGAPAASGLPAVFEVITDATHWASATFPVAITKNVVTAIGRLITTAADIPAAWMQGKAQEIRAVSDVNVQLTKSTGKQIAREMQVPEEFAVAAANKHARQIVGKQINVQRVVHHAIEQLKLEASNTDAEAQGAPAVPVEDISEDWLNAFAQEAMNMSSEAMQRHFGRILAGEISKPTSFSIKTIKLVAQLDNTAASLFTKLCSLSIFLRFPGSNIIVSPRVVSMGSAGANSLSSFDLSFDNLNILQEYGLIISDFNSYGDYQVAVRRIGFGGFPFTHQNRHWVFVPKSEVIPNTPFHVYGVALTASGRELLPIVDIVDNLAYLTAMKGFFELQGCLVEEVQPPILNGVNT